MLEEQLVGGPAGTDPEPRLGRTWLVFQCEGYLGTQRGSQPGGQVMRIPPENAMAHS